MRGEELRGTPGLCSGGNCRILCLLPRRKPEGQSAGDPGWTLPQEDWRTLSSAGILLHKPHSRFKSSSTLSGRSASVLTLMFMSLYLGCSERYCSSLMRTKAE